MWLRSLEKTKQPAAETDLFADAGEDDEEGEEEGGEADVDQDVADVFDGGDPVRAVEQHRTVVLEGVQDHEVGRR